MSNFFAPEGKFEPAGMFTLPHIISLIVCICLIAVALFFSRKISNKELKKLTLIFAIIITTLEIIKITYKFTVNHISFTQLDSWMPLFYCSLFIYSTWMSCSKSHLLNQIGDAFITGGCIVGGFSFLIIPSTSLMLVPIWHFLSVHSLLYHSMMVYLGILYIIRGHFKFTKKAFLFYTIFLFIFIIPCELTNILTQLFSLIGSNKGSNLMLLHAPYNMPFKFIYALYDAVPYLYPFIAALVYLCIPYGISYLIAFTINKFKKNND